MATFGQWEFLSRPAALLIMSWTVADVTWCHRFLVEGGKVACIEVGFV